MPLSRNSICLACVGLIAAQDVPGAVVTSASADRASNHRIVKTAVLKAEDKVLWCSEMTLINPHLRASIFKLDIPTPGCKVHLTAW